MKIAMVGCGAVGSYYGAMLSRAGGDVHFWLRSDYEVGPRCARTPDEIGLADIVFVALKTTANGEFPRLLPPLVGPKTAVVTLQNGLGNEEQLARLFPGEQILGGLCFVCLNRISPGVIHHLDHGMIVLGEHQRYPEPRTHEIAAMIRHAGVPCKVTDNLARAHWEKLVWNIPFNGLGVASAAGYDALRVPNSKFQVPSPPGPCLTTDKLLSDVRWEQLVRELMLEVVAAANAQGLAVSDSLVEKQIERTRTMGAYKASTLLDFEQRRPLELESLFAEPLRQAHGAGLATPRLARLVDVLKQLDSQRTGE
jgi:2-dehydropantoate 2-reductase